METQRQELTQYCPHRTWGPEEGSCDGYKITGMVLASWLNRQPDLQFLREGEWGRVLSRHPQLRLASHWHVWPLLLDPGIHPKRGELRRWRNGYLTSCPVVQSCLLHSHSALPQSLQDLLSTQSSALCYCIVTFLALLCCVVHLDPIVTTSLIIFTLLFWNCADYSCLFLFLFENCLALLFSKKSIM